MRKGVVLVAMFIILVSSVYATHEYGAKVFTYSSLKPVEDCAETDNSDDPYIKGAISFFTDKEEKKYEDKCRDLRFLLEYSCDSKIAYEPIAIYCQNGCKDGACSDLSNYKLVSPIIGSNIYKGVGRYEARYPSPQPGTPVYQRAKEYVATSYTTDIYCKQTEGSGDKFVKGSIEIIYPDTKSEKLTDFCWSPRTLKEYSCNNKNPSMPAYVFCDGICKDGTCTSWLQHTSSR